MRSLSLDKTFHGLMAWDSFIHLAHGEAIGTNSGEPLYHASLAAQEYEELLESNRFEVEAQVV